jgi:hypothetical protein
MLSQGRLLRHTYFYQYEWFAEFQGGDFYSELKSNPDSWARANNWRGVNGGDYRIMDFDNSECGMSFTPDLSYVQYHLQRAAASIYTKGFDALTAGAEAHKILDLFRNVVGHIVHLKRTFGSVKAVADAWLSYRYGVRPLLYDIRDLHGAIVEFEEKRELYSQRSGYSYSESSTDTVYSGSQIGQLVYTLTKTTDVNYSIRGSVSARFQPSRILLDPVTTAWELTRYSFVIDWVLGVGVYLQSTAFKLFSQEYVASYGFQTDYVVRYELTGSDGSLHKGHASCVYEYRGTTQKRVPSSIDNLPSLTGQPLSLAHIADLLALVRQSGTYR